MRSIRRMKKWFVVSSLIFLLAACTGIEGEASMQVWLDAPQNGSTFQVGDTVLLHTHARDVNGPGIEEFHFFANDQLLAIGEADVSLPLVHSFMGWNPTEAGSYDVYIRAISVSGASAESVHIRVTISEHQFKEQGSGADASLTPTFTKPPVTPTHTTTPVTPTTTPSPTRTITQRPPEVHLYADDTFLSPGECTTLTWETANTTSVTLNDLPVSNYSGSTSVCPLSTITYTLIGNFSGGSVIDSVTINMSYEFPSQKYSSYVNLSITGGHGSIHHIGDTAQICYSFNSASYLFEFRDYSPATPGSGGATGPYNVLADGSMYDAKNVCKNYTLVEPGGYEAFQFRVEQASESPDPILVDYAEVWIYILP